jgi:hypothetical protein
MHPGYLQPGRIIWFMQRIETPLDILLQLHNNNAEQSQGKTWAHMHMHTAESLACPQSVICTRLVGLPFREPHTSMRFTTGIPSTTLPNTTAEQLRASSADSDRARWIRAKIEWLGMTHVLISKQASPTHRASRLAKVWPKR